MNQSYDDLILFQPKIGFLSSVAAFLQKFFVLRPLSWITPWSIFSNFRLHNGHAAKAYLFYLRRQARFPELIDFLILLITDSRLSQSQIWSICKLGLYAVQVCQLNPDAIILTKIERLIHVVQDRLAVETSYNCSYTFICLSLWRFQRGQMEMALSLAARATQADSTWGYPLYLLGWYGCFTLEFDPLPFFFDAMDKDWRFAKKILNDKIIQHQTGVIHEIKQKLLISNSKKPKILMEKK